MTLISLCHLDPHGFRSLLCWLLQLPALQTWSSFHSLRFTVSIMAALRGFPQTPRPLVLLAQLPMFMYPWDWPRLVQVSTFVSTICEQRHNHIVGCLFKIVSGRVSPCWGIIEKKMTGCPYLGFLQRPKMPLQSKGHSWGRFWRHQHFKASQPSG